MVVAAVSRACCAVRRGPAMMILRAAQQWTIRRKFLVPHGQMRAVRPGQWRMMMRTLRIVIVVSAAAAIAGNCSNSAAPAPPPPLTHPTGVILSAAPIHGQPFGLAISPSGEALLTSLELSRVATGNSETGALGPFITTSAASDVVITRMAARRSSRSAARRRSSPSSTCGSSWSPIRYRRSRTRARCARS